MRRVVAVAAASLALASASLAPSLRAADPNRAGVVVRFGDGDVRRMCVAFDEPKISGADLLARSGLDTEVDQSSVGTAICNIEGEGCGSGDCFCRYPTFWGYWVRVGDDDPWRFSEIGAADRDVSDGTVDGWSFGRDGKPQPPKVPFTEVCPASARDSVAPPTADDRRSTAQPVARARSEPGSPSDYVAFAAFAAVFAACAAFLYVLRRRR